MLKDIRKNILFLTDVYNTSHFKLKINTDYEVSHIYNRSRGMILYGFNEAVIDLLNTKIEVDMVEEARESAYKMDMIFPFDMWYKVATELEGQIPLRVQALPDGTWVPKGTPFAQVMNTVEGFGEIVTWFEPEYLHTYFPSGCATEALHLRQYLEDGKLPLHRFHSFGMRGHRSLEDAYWAATAWNLFLTGTDDFHGIFHTPNANIKSIPATAHKTMQQFDDEFDGFIRAIDVAVDYKQKMVALVIDTYDPDRVIEEMAGKLITYAKTKGVHVVFRPDSGDLIGQTMRMWELYKYADNWSIIIGEGMTREKVEEYDIILKNSGFPLDRISYGIGAGFYKHIDRDWLGHAMKTAYSNGKPRMKFSTPFKTSIPNTIGLVMVDGKMTVDYTRDGEFHDALFYDVYHYDTKTDRPFWNRQDWDDIQKIAMSNLNKPLQEEIVLSELIKTSIKEFKVRYA
ncbi:hypothetical protein LCGC14_1054760 [marine sediment metagenome]|uniref:Nicotinamide phosphoribosyltransferase n=1 Tax=marine sediment metagenome TaxID=412755 RepID=A0A0F9MMU4_9ZZZZ